MNRLLASAAALTVTCVAAVFSGGSAWAAVPPHYHWLTTGSGSVVRVGPNVCVNPAIYDAWLNFHLNVHKGVPGTQAFTNPSNPVSIAGTLC